MSFHSRRFAGRSHDHIIVAQTRDPLMNQYASKTSIPLSVGADVSGIETLVCAENLNPNVAVMKSAQEGV
jgi:hypothetical protein